MKNIIVFIALTLLSTTAVQADMSQYGQYGQYGGGTTSTAILVDKMVSTGTTTKGGVMSYVDNYSPADPRLKPGDKVYFTIKVKNTSNVALNNIKMTDVMPAQLDAVEGPGVYDAKAKTLTWTYPSLAAGEGKIEKVVAIVRAQDILPSDKGLMCLTNRAIAQADGASNQDTTQFCVEKQVAPVTSAPKAGPELGLLFLAGNFGILGAGIALRKKI